MLLLKASTGSIYDFVTEDWPHKKYISLGLVIFINFLTARKLAMSHLTIFSLFKTLNLTRFFS